MHIFFLCIALAGLEISSLFFVFRICVKEKAKYMNKLLCGKSHFMLVYLTSKLCMISDAFPSYFAVSASQVANLKLLQPLKEGGASLCAYLVENYPRVPDFDTFLCPSYKTLQVLNHYLCIY